MFIDTSVIIAILSNESDAGTFVKLIRASESPICSALVVLEAAMRLSTKLSVEPLDVQSAISDLLGKLNIEIVPIPSEAGNIAIAAFSRYGKGRGHSAQLNLADCLSYACAKISGVPLLYKGNDFARTDLA